jgi:hypothetical protein
MAKNPVKLPAGFVLDQATTEQTSHTAVLPSGFTLDQASPAEKEAVTPETRKALPFMSLKPEFEEGVTPTPRRVAQAVTGRGLGNILAGLQREEAMGTEILRNIIKRPEIAASFAQSAVQPTQLLRVIPKIASQPEVQSALKGKTAPEMGDILREAGAPEGVAATGGFLMSAALPSNILGGKFLKSAAKGIKGGARGILNSIGIQSRKAAKRPGLLARAGALITGVEQDVLQEASERGFRNVLQKRFFDKKIPAAVQETIEKNLDDVLQIADNKFDEATKSLRNTAVDTVRLKKDLFKGLKKKRFVKKTPEENLLRKVTKDIENADIKNLGDLLDFRRELDDVIFNESELQRTGTKQIKTIRDNARKILRENPLIKAADDLWFNLKIQTRDIGKKVTSDTGENFLKRFSKLTARQKQKLVTLERELLNLNPNAQPFISDLTNFSLAQDFTTPATSALRPVSLLEKTAKPLFRGALRTGEAAQAGARRVGQALPFTAIPITKRATR